MKSKGPFLPNWNQSLKSDNMSRATGVKGFYIKGLLWLSCELMGTIMVTFDLHFNLTRHVLLDFGGSATPLETL